MNNLKVSGSYNSSHLKQKITFKQCTPLLVTEDKKNISGNSYPLSLIALKNYNLPALAFGNKKHIYQSTLNNPCIAFQGKGSAVLKMLSSNNAGIESINIIDNLSEKDKKEFVKEFCALTGFPYLEKVTPKMLSHAKDQIRNISDETDTPVLWSGYHKYCSVSSGLAFPGSDIDALCFIVDGNQDQINTFKHKLWQSLNPLQVSIRKDHEFPDVFNLDQLHQWTKIIDEIALNNELNLKTEEYLKNQKEKSDYHKALAFNIDITTYLDKENIEILKQKAPALAQFIDQGEKPRWITIAMSSLLESLRNGKVLIPENLTDKQRKKFDAIKNSYLYKYGNMGIQNANYEIKPKLLARKEINDTTFNNLSLEEQMDLIKRMIYESYPSREKSKVTDVYGSSFNKMFDNGDGTDSSRDEAFRKCT